MVVELVAYDEAGHGTLARIYRAHVLDCRVEDHFLKGRNSGGSTRWVPLHAAEKGPMRKVRMLEDMAIVIAGPLAVRNYCPPAAMMCEAARMNDPDLQQFHKMAIQYHFANDAGETDPERTRDSELWDLPVIGEVWGQTELELKANWSAVEGVAKSLMKYGEISEKNIDREIQRAGGRKSVVDYLLEHGSEAEKEAARVVISERQTALTA